MSEVASPVASGDGVLSVHPQDREQFAIKHVPGTLPSAFLERIEAGGDLGGLQLFTRSVIGQMGVNITPNGDPILKKHHKEVIAYSPVAITAHSDIGEMVLEDFDTLRKRRKGESSLRSPGQHATIEAGRYVDFTQYSRMSKAETEDALNTCLLAIKDPDDTGRSFHVNENGSVTVPIALIETLLNANALNAVQDRLNAIKHGRAGLIPYTDTVERQASDLVPKFLIGGIALSPGPFTCVIREAIDEAGNTKQLSGAALIDGNRLMGIGRDLDPYTGHRQIEVANLDEALTFGATSVTIDLFQYSGNEPDLSPVVDWYSMSVDQRRKLHERGINPLDVIRVADPSARRQLRQAYDSEDIAGVILSSHGGTPVAQGETDYFTAQNVELAATSYGRQRSLPQELQGLERFVKELAPAGDRSRVFIGNRLLPEHMARIVESGDVRSFFVEDFGDQFMRQQIHSKMIEMVQSGVSIGWDHDGKIRYFHRSGLLMTKEEIDRFENLRMVIAMYGTHRPSVDHVLDPHVGNFFDQLTDLMEVEYLGITHGNGPGVMRMSDVLARERGMMSIGVGILVEGQEEGPDVWLPNAAVQFQNSERLYRQQLMDKIRMIAVLNLGGYGTLEEAAITLCTTKLNSTIPAPTIMVDPTGRYFKPIEEQFKKASQESELVLWGEVVDISDRPFGQEWVANTVHNVKNYAEAYDVIERFWKDPAAYWKEKEIPAREVAKAYYAQLDEWDKMGMNMPDRITRAVRQYAPEFMRDVALI